MNLIRLINRLFWGYPALLLLLGMHLYFTFRLKGVQKHVFYGIRLSLRPQGHRHGLSGFSALMTMLAATLGTGNIIGMSTAVALGGPGAVFWCWMTGVLGMATSYAECYLAHRFRQEQADGRRMGGSMYMFRSILHMPLAGMLYALAMIASSLLLGCAAQSNSIALASGSAFGVPPILSGILLALLVSAVLIGGAHTVGKICSFLVPFMGIFYIMCCILLLILTRNTVPSALKLIFCSAFSTKSLTGGLLGGGLNATLRYGIARGLFTNEAGLGTAGVTAAEASTAQSVHQGLISMTGVFWDTVVMCGITGLLIVASFLQDPASIVHFSAGELTLAAFSRLPFGKQLLGVSLILFALSTVIGWFFLGERSLLFLTTKKRHHDLYRCLYLTMSFIGSILALDAMWELTDFVNLFLLLPNAYLLWKLRAHVPPADAVPDIPKRHPGSCKRLH